MHSVLHINIICGASYTTAMNHVSDCHDTVLVVLWEFRNVRGTECRLLVVGSHYKEAQKKNMETAISLYKHMAPMHVVQSVQLRPLHACFSETFAGYFQNAL